MCESKSCCWNDQTSKCMEKHCSNSYNGIPERYCTQLGCAYDQQSKECYHLGFCGYSFESTTGKFSKNSVIKSIVRSKNLPDSYSRRCAKRSVFEVDLKNIRNLKLTLFYETPGRGYHFSIVNDYKEYLLAAKNEKLYINGFRGRQINLFESKGVVTLVLNNLKHGIEIRKDSESIENFEASFFKNTRKIFIYINTFETLFFSGAGLCNFCLSYT